MMEREHALRIVHRCAAMDHEFRSHDGPPDVHTAVQLWQDVEPLMSAAAATLGRMTVLMEYASHYISLQIATDRR